MRFFCGIITTIRHFNKGLYLHAINEEEEIDAEGEERKGRYATHIHTR